MTLKGGGCVAEFQLTEAKILPDLPIEIAGLRLDALLQRQMLAILGPKDAVLAIDGVPVDRFVRVYHERGQIVGMGRNQALIDFEPLVTNGLTIENSDGWVRLRLTGARADAVMRLLTPLDLRPTKTPTNSVYRSLIGHIAAVIIVSDEGFEILVGSSFARSAVHDISSAMRTVVALGDRAR